MINKSYLTNTTDSYLLATVEDRLISHSIDYLQDIIKDNNARMKNYNTENAVQTLAKGFFYPNEYALALTKTSQTARLQFFKKKWSFLSRLSFEQAFCNKNE